MVRGIQQHRRSVVGKLGHISRVATLEGAAFARYSGAFGVRTRGEGRKVLLTS